MPRHERDSEQRDEDARERDATGDEQEGVQDPELKPGDMAMEDQPPEQRYMPFPQVQQVPPELQRQQADDARAAAEAQRGAMQQGPQAPQVPMTERERPGGWAEDDDVPGERQDTAGDGAREASERDERVSGSRSADDGT